MPPLAVPLRLRPRQSAAALMKKEYERDKKEARAAIRQFEERARKAGVPSVEGLWVEAEAEAILALRARTADLVVLSQPGEDELGALGGHATEAAILAVGRNWGAGCH